MVFYPISINADLYFFLSSRVGIMLLSTILVMKKKK